VRKERSLYVGMTLTSIRIERAGHSVGNHLRKMRKGMQTELRRRCPDGGASPRVPCAGPREHNRKDVQRERGSYNRVVIFAR